MRSVTVSIAAYNERVTLSKPLNYLMCHERDLVDEVIVCANGSTDGTENVVLNYGERDPRIKLLCSRKGKPHAWNALIQGARNESVVFLDADVTPQLGAIGKLLSHFGPETLIVAGRDRPVAKWYQPGACLLGYLFRSRADDYLNGRFYATRRTLLLDKMELKTGQRRMPPDLIDEDTWLQLLLESHELVVSSDAWVEYFPGNWSEYPKMKARYQLASEQLMAKFPELYQRWHAGRPSPNLTVKRKILSAYHAGGIRLVASRFMDKSIRSLVSSLYGRQVRRWYVDLNECLQTQGGAILLANEGRVRSSKV